MFVIISRQIKFCCKYFKSHSLNTFSSLPRIYTKSEMHMHAEKCVLVSKSTNIFENLALEDWLYENESFINKSVLLIWKNTPSVVIGRHQNPWHECNMQKMMADNVCLARRNSGGGAVYHDEGNVNFSFHCSRTLYDRHKNLELVIDAVRSLVDINLAISDRDDIILDDIYKISGSASKLAHEKSYHHFSLLVNVDVEKLQEYLLPTWYKLDSRATASVPSAVSCLSQVDYTGQLSFVTIVKTVGQLYISRNSCIDEEKQVQYVIPDETNYPGIHANIAKFQCWEWIFGKTPKFAITRTFNLNRSGENILIKLTITVDKGYITDIEIYSVLENNSLLTHYLKEKFQNCRLVRKDINRRLDSVKSCDYFSEFISDSQTRKSILLYLTQMLIF